jgi:DNA polymerase III sliding clamp (beta) subunit (PCNA family)
MSLKVQVGKDEFHRAITRVSCALGDKNDDVKTRNFGIEAKDGKLSVIAARRDICARYVLEDGALDVQSEGKLVVDGYSLLSDITNYHTGVTLELSVEEGDSDDTAKQLKINYKTGRGKTWEHDHSLLPPSLFPDIDFEWQSKHCIQYPANQFIRNIERTARAASDESHHMEYCILLIRFTTEGVVFFAGDGRQMSYVMDSDHLVAEESMAMIRAKLVTQFSKRKVLDASGDLNISIEETEDDAPGRMKIDQDNFTVISNFASAKRLPYENILKIPHEHCSFEINSEVLRQDLKALSNPENKDTVWHFSKDGIEVKNVGSYSKKKVGSIAGVSNYEGKECQMEFSLSYWESVLATCEKDAVLKVLIHNPRVPINIEVSPSPDLHKFYIMPINDVE